MIEEKVTIWKAVAGSQIKEVVGKAYADVAKSSTDNIISTLGKKLDSLPKADTISNMEKNVTKDIQKVIDNKQKEDRAVNILIYNVTESEKEDGEERRSEDITSFMAIAEALGGSSIEVKKAIRL